MATSLRCSALPHDAERLCPPTLLLPRVSSAQELGVCVALSLTQVTAVLSASLGHCPCRYGPTMASKERVRRMVGFGGRAVVLSAVLKSLQRRAELLWSCWYGTVALRGCRLGLLHPRGAPPLLPDIPHSRAPLMKTHTRLCFSSSRRSLQLCTALAFSLPTFSSSTGMIQNSDRASCWAPSLSFLL